jgi:hypothetical protein
MVANGFNCINFLLPICNSKIARRISPSTSDDLQVFSSLIYFVYSMDLILPCRDSERTNPEFVPDRQFTTMFTPRRHDGLGLAVGK